MAEAAKVPPYDPNPDLKSSWLHASPRPRQLNSGRTLFARARVYISAMDQSYWHTALLKAEQELDVARTRTVVNEAAAKPRRTKAELNASSRARRRGLRALAGLSWLVLAASQASALPQVQMQPWPGFLLVQAAKPGEPTAKPREQPSAGQQNQQAPLTELNQVLDATRAKLGELFGGTGGMAERRTESELLRQENERLNTQLAAAKGQVGEAMTAAVEAERARQRAVSEARQVRGEAERANAELAAALSEIERFKTANRELEQQIASLNADSKSAMETARETLTIMKEKIGELLSATFAKAGLTETTPAPAPKLNSAALADKHSNATAALSGKVETAPQKPGDTGAADQRADMPGPTAGPTQPNPFGLERFNADVRHLNGQAMKLEGADLFSGVEAAGDGVVHVRTTAAWQNIPAVGQRSYLGSLFDLWTVAKEGNGPTVVQIVDPNGRVLLEKSGTEQDTDRD
jgi:hypothetical protein